MQEETTKGHLVRIDDKIQKIYQHATGEFNILPNKMFMSESDLLELAEVDGTVTAEMLIELYEQYVKAKQPEFIFRGYRLQIQSLNDSDDENNPKAHSIALVIIN